MSLKVFCPISIKIKNYIYIQTHTLFNLVTVPEVTKGSMARLRAFGTFVIVTALGRGMLIPGAHRLETGRLGFCVQPLNGRGYPLAGMRWCND